MNWVIMPYVGNVEQTGQAVADVLNQSLPDVHLLLINQGGGAASLDIADPRVHRWTHDPPLPSLAATWNRALTSVWLAGARQALVVNNDVRLPVQLYEALLQAQRETQGWFVSACNVGETVWLDPQASLAALPLTTELLAQRGGPDFSCFLITKSCHLQYPFDEGFTPAYCEDLDYHRRLMLGGHGDRIFSLCIPYLHYASGTLKDMPPERRRQWEETIEAGSRVHYRRKWGGDVNQERYTIPFDATSARDGVTTPDLQHRGVPI